MFVPEFEIPLHLPVVHLMLERQPSINKSVPFFYLNAIIVIKRHDYSYLLASSVPVYFVSVDTQSSFLSSERNNEKGIKMGVKQKNVKRPFKL